MADDPLILAIDQGTTSSRAIVFDRSGRARAVAQTEFPQHFPKPGWVEHNPEDIWETTVAVSRKAIEEAEAGGGQVVGIGITNQRETTLVWDRSTGEPLYNAIVWQDRRTADICSDLKTRMPETDVNARSGLLLDPYFSSTKAAWILDNVDGARTRAEAGDALFGTVDSFLLWRMTGGRVHATDVTNASRTNLYNIHDLDWDDTLLELFGVPRACLPDVRDCADDFGETESDLFGRPLPILGIAGDQQAAGIGQACFAPGTIKSTYGTGCFVILNTGDTAVTSGNRLLTTVGYRIGDTMAYAMEGSIFMAGAAVQWLRDGLGLIKHSAETEDLAAGLTSNDGVYLVPAFTGLGAPYWEPNARAGILGMTRDTGPAHVARATVEAVGYQTADLFAAMAEDGVSPSELRVDGGMVANNWFVQFLADILKLPVDRPVVTETTALGAFYLAALQVGLYTSLDDIAAGWQRERRFEPAMPDDERAALLAGWKDAVSRIRP